MRYREKGLPLCVICQQLGKSTCRHCPKCHDPDCVKHCYSTKSHDFEHDPVATSTDLTPSNGKIVVEFSCVLCGVRGDASIPKSIIDWS